MDGEVTKFFDGLTGTDSLGLDEQKKETQEEMRLIANLASSFENREEKKRARILNVGIGLISLFAICDFLYALSKDFHSATEEVWLPSLRMTIEIVLCLAAILAGCYWAVSRRRKGLRGISEDS